MTGAAAPSYEQWILNGRSSSPANAWRNADAEAQRMLDAAMSAPGHSSLGLAATSAAAATPTEPQVGNTSTHDWADYLAGSSDSSDADVSEPGTEFDLSSRIIDSQCMDLMQPSGELTPPPYEGYTWQDCHLWLTPLEHEYATMAAEKLWPAVRHWMKCRRKAHIRTAAARRIQASWLRRIWRAAYLRSAHATWRLCGRPRERARMLHWLAHPRVRASAAHNKARQQQAARVQAATTLQACQRMRAARHMLRSLAERAAGLRAAAALHEPSFCEHVAQAATKCLKASPMRKLAALLSAASSVQPASSSSCAHMTPQAHQSRGNCLRSLQELLHGVDMQVVGACEHIRITCGDHQMATTPPYPPESHLPIGGYTAAATAIQSLARGMCCRDKARDIGMYFVRAGAARDGDPGTISRSGDIVIEHDLAAERTRVLGLVADINATSAAPVVIIGAVLTIQSIARGRFIRIAAGKVMVDLEYFARRANGHHARAADPLQMFVPFLRSELRGMQQGFDMLYPSPPSVTDSEDSGFESMSDSPCLLTTFDADTDWNRLRTCTTIIQSHVRALLTRRTYQAALSDMYDQYQCVCDGCLADDEFDVRLVRRTVVAHIHETLGELQHAHTQDEMAWFHAFDFLDPYN